MDDNSSAKEKILETVVLLLREKKDISKITNREIASLAGVNSALINYYFQSKENLLNTGVGICMGDVFTEIIENAAYDDVDPILRLKNMMKAIAELGFNNYSLAQIIVATEMKDGCLSTNKMILPILKEIFGNLKTELELKLIACQLLTPLQTVFLHAEEYRKYLLCDLFDDESRNQLLDTMFENLLSMTKWDGREQIK